MIYIFGLQKHILNRVFVWQFCNAQNAQQPTTAGSGRALLRLKTPLGGINRRILPFGSAVLNWSKQAGQRNSPIDQAWRSRLWRGTNVVTRPSITNPLSYQRSPYVKGFIWHPALNNGTYPSVTPYGYWIRDMRKPFQPSARNPR